MKAISASIIVLAGMMCFGIGILVNHADTQAFACSVGIFVTAAGVFGWFKSMRSPDA